MPRNAASRYVTGAIRRAVQPSTPPAPAGIVDAMTGKATMDAGRRAAKKIRAVSQQERQDLDNALAP